MSRAACRMNDGEAVSMKWGQSESHYILQVTSPCWTQLSSLKNNDVCHRAAVHQFPLLVL